MSGDKLFTVTYQIDTADTQKYMDHLTRFTRLFPAYTFSIKVIEDMVRRPSVIYVQFPMEEGDGVPLDMLASRRHVPKKFMDKLYLVESFLRYPDLDLDSYMFVNDLFI